MWGPISDSSESTPFGSTRQNQLRRDTSLKSPLFTYTILLISVVYAPTYRAEFLEVASEVGFHFVHENGNENELWTVEIVGAGVGILDFDNDGRMDIWAVQGGPLRATRLAKPGDRLFRNVSTSETLRFEDVTEISGVRATGYGMGIATADIDNDGDTDVFLANFGANQLYENVGGGKFVDITKQAGLEVDAWSIGASFADIDADVLLYLYVVNYLDLVLEEHKACRNYSSRLTYCGPQNYPPSKDHLYRNLGNGRFENATESSGIGQPPRRGMGVSAGDFNGDGQIDFYVANDAGENFLWFNQSGGRFVDGGLLSGAALNIYGIAEASMGVAVSDYDQDGDPDLFLTHDVKESNTLYVNDGCGWFDDQSSVSGLATSSIPFTGFGTGWIDMDRDGDLDLFSANGAVTIIESQRREGLEPPLRQRNQVWRKYGKGIFYEGVCDDAFSAIDVSRGAAFGDLDNDGDTAIVVANNNGPAKLYRNDAPSSNWLGIELIDNQYQRHAIGASARREAYTNEVRYVATDGSYASSHDHRLTFNSLDVSAPQFIRVRWANGVIERFGPLAPNRYHVLMSSTPGDEKSSSSTTTAAGCSRSTSLTGE